MKAAVKMRKGPGVDVLDVEKPVVADADILIRVRAASLCGSDVHVYEWTPGYEWLPVPVTLGHEFSGEVVEVGERVSNVALGDRVTALPLMPCSRCKPCHVGRGDACVAKVALGLLADGAFAEYVRVTGGAHVFRLPAGVSHEAAALCEPLSVALHAVELAAIKPGQTAAVLGPGPIGLLTLQALKVSGASFVLVTGTAADRVRLEVAGRLGADELVNVDETDPVQRAMDLTGGSFGGGFDLVFEAAGNPRTVSQGLAMARPGGKLVLLGIHPAPAQIHPTDLVRGGKSILGAYAYDPDTWRRALALLASGQVRTDPMITHRVPLADARSGFELAVQKKAAKVLFLP
ncbi:MAG: alcohol dehydrogenase catalytic domain-containing protein [bacterium]